MRLLAGSGSLPIACGPYGVLASLLARPESAQDGARGDERRPIFHRGLLGFKCIVFGRVWDSWLVVARVLCRSVGMAVWVLSLHIQTATKTVHVAPNGIVFVLCVAHYLSISLYLSLPPSHFPLSMMHMLLPSPLHLSSPLLCALLLAGTFSKSLSGTR